MYIDLLLLLIIIFFSLSGLFQGFLRQIFSLLMWCCLLFLAQPLSIWIKAKSGLHWVQQSPVFVLWGFAALLIIIFFKLLHVTLPPLRRPPSLTPADRWLGLGFGALKGIFLAFFISVLVQVPPEEIRQKFGDIYKDSRNSNFVSVASNILSWQSISSIHGLHQIQNSMKETSTTLLKTPPWEMSPKADRD